MKPRLWTITPKADAVFKVTQQFPKSKAKPIFNNFGAMLDKDRVGSCNSEQSPIRLFQRFQYDDQQLQITPLTFWIYINKTYRVSEGVVVKGCPHGG